MTISSRTPEGEPNCCPVCGKAICIESSQPFGDAPCPNCGHLLWFVGANSQYRFFDHDAAQSVQDRFVDWLVTEKRTSPAIARLAISGNRIALEQLGLDSLETVEMAMEFEEMIRE